MKILITGAGGQLGLTLQQLAPCEHEIIPLTSRQLDITNRKAVNEIVHEIKPDVIINTAAYTAVDKANPNRTSPWPSTSSAPKTSPLLPKRPAVA